MLLNKDALGLLVGDRCGRMAAAAGLCCSASLCPSNKPSFGNGHMDAAPS